MLGAVCLRSPNPSIPSVFDWGVAEAVDVGDGMNRVGVGEVV
jgi:hypothetical protein